MDYLWTPWRYQYITSAAAPGECVFCAAAQSRDDRARLVVHRAARNFVILNRFPYTSGHIMVVPYEHAATLEALPDETLVELIRLARASETHLRAIYRPEGLNLGMNIGRSAGAGIAGHVHLHVLPRWTGDTNFMTVTGETRVLPEDLEVTWEKVRAQFARHQ
ncbi:MAG: HIT domain-containing protein [Acidobacteriia bacterium]|nr:HIT domain-containing protein [Terriglobia bacterium]